MTKSTGQRRRYPKEIDDQIEALKRQGRTAASIAEELKVPLTKVLKLVRLRKVKLTKEQRRQNVKEHHLRLVPENMHKEIFRLREEEFLSSREIANRLSVKLSSIQGVIQLAREKNIVSNILKDKERLAKAHQGRHSWGNLTRALLDLKMSIEEESRPDSDPMLEYVNVKCFCGHVFKTRSYDVMGGRRKSCGCLKSFPQKELFELVKSYGQNAIWNDWSVLGDLELDIYLPDLKIGIEYCGLFWHGEKLKGTSARHRHLDKLKLCEAAGVRLITIFADEWLCRRNAVEGYLRAILKVQSKKIGARKLTLVKGDLPAVRDFQEANHIQGHSGSDAYSLRDENGKILSSATFLFVNREWQLVRYCTATDTQVLGGFQRLLKAFIEDHKPEKIVTFSDRRWSVGDTYLRNGFILDAEIKPSYWYFIRKDDTERLHKSGFRKEKIEKKLGPLFPGETEWEAMQRFGYDRIWDCGLRRWVLTLPLTTPPTSPNLSSANQA